LFGDRAEDLNTLLDLLEETIEGGFIVKEKYAALYENSYAYVDDENSRRICEEIQKRTWNIKTEKRYV
jgi:tRNA A-37 threonylcarbamoyl transferase component Bud32